MNKVAARKTPDAMQLLNDSIGEIKKALPSVFNADRFVRIVVTEIRKNPALKECDPYSFIGAVIQSAQLGLEIGSGLGYAYLVPYKKECQLIIGYKGIADLTRRSGQIAGIHAECVYKNDSFEYYVKDSVPMINHKPSLGMKSDKDIIAAYAIASFVNGGQAQCAVMPIEEIIFIMSEVSSSKNARSPWNLHFAEMCKKTAVRRVGKMLPQSPQYVQAMQIDDKERKAHQPFIDMGIIDAEYEVSEKVNTADLAKDAAKQGDYKPAGAVDKDHDNALMDFEEAINICKERRIDFEAALLKTSGSKSDQIMEGKTDRIRAATAYLIKELKK